MKFDSRMVNLGATLVRQYFPVNIFKTRGGLFPTFISLSPPVVLVGFVSRLLLQYVAY